MFRYKKILFPLVICFWFACLQGQVSYGQIEDKFDKYQSNGLQEKIFAHCNKQFYLPGEVVWCKIYVADAAFHKALDISKVAYVELINNNKVSVLQAKIALTKGNGNGSFMLPASISSGNYLLRAYTNWMKNSDPEFYFEKLITIVNPKKIPNWPMHKDSLGYDLQFFPEGGNLVQGLESKVAFRIINQYGQGVTCSGVVVNEKNDTVVNFSTLQFGMGHFRFRPLKNSNYKALVTLEGNRTITKTLPNVEASGWVMQLTETGAGELKIMVNASESTSGAPVYLFAQTRQLKKVSLTQQLIAGKAEFVVDKKLLGEGITQFTLFNYLQQPVCERLFFQRPQKKLLIHTTSDQPEYATRKKVTLQLKTTDNINTPEDASLSLSVYLIDSLQRTDDNTILNYFYLNSDLKGIIESPGYYFSNSDPVANEALDNLMLTHGWRRFKWESILAGKRPSPAFLPEVEGHLLTVRTIDSRTKLPVPNTPVSLSIPGVVSQFSNSVSDDRGEACLNLKLFYGANEPIIHTNKANIELEIVNPFSEKFSSTSFPLFQLNEEWKQQLLSRSIGSQVEYVYAADKKQQFYLSSPFDSTAFYGMLYKKYLLDDYTRFSSIQEVVQEYIPELRLKKAGNSYKFQVLNIPYKSFFERDPLLLLDGIPIANSDKIVEFDPLKIKKIEVVAGKYYRSGAIEEGIVNFCTYDGDLSGFALDSGSLITSYEGMQLQREFYSPVYETSDQALSRLPDFRNVLYWSPEIKTGRSGKTELSFYTSDMPGRYAIVVNASNHSGLIGSNTIFFSVKNH
jgi:hypothetical protein